MKGHQGTTKSHLVDSETGDYSRYSFISTETEQELDKPRDMVPLRRCRALKKTVLRPAEYYERGKEAYKETEQVQGQKNGNMQEG